MKTTIFFALAVLSFSSFAQRPADQIINKIDRLSRAANEGRIDRMSRGEKDQLNAVLDTALSIVRDDGRDGIPDDIRMPRPDVRPYPGPGRDDRPGRVGRHGARDGMLIAALIENRMVVIRGRSPGDLLLNCTDAVNRAGLSNVDDMIVTVNGGRYIPLHTSGWWSGTQQICGVLMQQSQNDDYSRAAFVEVVGTIENSPIRLEGSRGEILEECAEATRSLGNVDDMNLSINGGRLTPAHTSGWWSGTAGICRQITSMIDEQIR